MFVPKIQSEIQFITVPNLLMDQNRPENNKSEMIEESFYALANHLTQNNLCLISERIFADLSEFSTIQDIRNHYFKNDGVWTAHLPTFIEGKSPYGEALSGIQALAVSIKNKTAIHQLKQNDESYGVLYKGADADYVLLSDVARHLPFNLDHTAQAQMSFHKASDILETINWSYKDVRRTWFYLDSILDWYDDFNVARNETYHSMGVLNGNPMGNIPASTGIEGKNALGHACTFDLLAMRERTGFPLNIKQLHNSKQNEATEYGSAFSRALSIQTKLNTYVFISGTASIDEQGKTIHPNNPEMQIRRTFENIASLLEIHHAGLESIVQATAFCKHAKDFELFESITKEYALNPKTIVCTVADVCRDDLLFEMDATALIDQHL